MPPSPPSTVTKSTPRSPRAISVASSSQKPISPTALLIPTGRPVASASSSTKSSIESTSWNAECREGEAQSSPTGIPRIPAISGVTLAPGSSPPSPGFAPCESLISIALTGAPATTSMSLSRLKVPSSLRQPKYDVPIWRMRSPPLRWYGERPPSPVFCIAPASAAPLLRAVTAGPDSDPKLIAEMFTTLAGRNALARPRGPPSTLAEGSGLCGSCRSGNAPANVRCFTYACPCTCSTSMSVPKPK